MPRKTKPQPTKPTKPTKPQPTNPTPENSAPERRKPRGRPFPKGRSPNPGGRPRLVKEVLGRYRTHLPELLDGLLELARDRDGDGKTRVAAIRELLDRLIGKAPQALELSGPEGAPLPVAGVGVVILPAELPLEPLRPVKPPADSGALLPENTPADEEPAR